MRPSSQSKPIGFGSIILLRLSNMYISTSSDICTESNAPKVTSKLSVVLLIQVELF